MDVQTLTIATPLGHSVALTRFSSALSNQKTLVISSATGVLQGYYKKFASYFASLGYTVLTFDYYGIGRSGSDLAALKMNRTDLNSWGSNDQAAVVKYAKDQNPQHQIILLTHSIGGQIVCFNPQYPLLDKIVMVASQSGYWRDFKGIHIPKMFLFWYAMIPTLTPLFGYFPAKKIGLFENLPKRVVYEWMRWGRKKRYMLHYYDDSSQFFDKIKAPILAMSFPRDDYAPKRTVDWLVEQFVNAPTERLHYIPGKKDLGKLRHFGFFREHFKSQLWELTHQWIEKKE